MSAAPPTRNAGLGRCVTATSVPARAPHRRPAPARALPSVPGAAVQDSEKGEKSAKKVRSALDRFDAPRNGPLPHVPALPTLRTSRHALQARQHPACAGLSPSRCRSGTRGNLPFLSHAYIYFMASATTTATTAGFTSSLSGLPDQVLLAHTRSLVLHEQALQLAVLDHLREIQVRHLYLRLGFSSLFDYAVRELGYSEGAAWRRIKAMRLCSQTAGTRERLQDRSLTLSAAALLQNTFDLQQRTASATAAAGRASAPAAAELLPGATGTAPEAGALEAEAWAPARPAPAPMPALDAAQRQELVAQASGKSTREVKQLLAGVAPELARPAERMRALGEDRWELKVVIDSACQRGIEQLRALLSHVDPHLTVGQLVERLVQDDLQRYDPGRPRRGRGGRRREASAGQVPEPKAQAGPAGGAASPAKRGAQEQPGVPPTPEGTSAGGSTPAPAARSAEEPARGTGRRRHLGGGSVVRGGVRASDWRRRHLDGGSAARAAGGAQDLRRQHPGACQASGGGARHRYFRSEVGGRLWVPRHRTGATADAAGRPVHAHRAASSRSWSQRSFASEAGRGGAARGPVAAAARGSRRVRGQRAAAPPGAPLPLHSGTGAARGVAPRRRMLQLRRSAQRAPLRVPLPAGARPHRSLCAWRQRRAGESPCVLRSPQPPSASGVRTAARQGHVIDACQGRELGGWASVREQRR